MKPTKQNRNVRNSVNSIGSSTENSSTSGKKRNYNFSSDEIWCLVTEYKKKSSELNLGTRERTQKCWEEITAAINDIHPEFHRSRSEIKKKWVGLLHDTKKQYYKAVADAKESGSSERRRLSDIAEVLIGLKGGFTAKERIKPKNGIRTVAVVPSADYETNSNFMSYSVPNREIGNCFDCANNLPSQEELSIDNIIRSIENGADLAAAESARKYCITRDLINLKRESLALKRHEMEFLERERLQKMEMNRKNEKLSHLKMQKAELEIMLLKAQLTSAVFTPMTINSNIG